MAQVPTTYAVFDQCVQGLTEISQAAVARAVEMGLSPIDILRDFKTYGFHVPRQTGALSWVTLNLVKNPRAIAIVLDHRIKEMVYGVHTCDNRFLTYREVQGMVGDLGKVWDVDTIYIYDSARVFSKLRIQKFYDWLATWDKLPEKIIRIN